MLLSTYLRFRARVVLLAKVIRLSAPTSNLIGASGGGAKINSPAVECLCYMTKVIFQIIPAHDSYLHSTQLGNIAQHLEAYQQFSLFLHPTFLPFTTSIIPFTAIIPSKAARFFVWAATSLTRPLTGTQYTLSCS